jgi:hypothetical protein
MGEMRHGEEGLCMGLSCSAREKVRERKRAPGCLEARNSHVQMRAAMQGLRRSSGA